MTMKTERIDNFLSAPGKKKRSQSWGCGKHSADVLSFQLSPNQAHWGKGLLLPQPPALSEPCLRVRVSAFAAHRSCIFEKSVCIYTPLFLWCSLKFAAAGISLSFVFLRLLLLGSCVNWRSCKYFWVCLPVLRKMTLLCMFSIVFVASEWSQEEKEGMLSSCSQVHPGSCIYSCPVLHSSAEVWLCSPAPLFRVHSVLLSLFEAYYPNPELHMIKISLHKKF